MRELFVLVLACVFGVTSLSAQMDINGVPTFGNEWMEYGLDHMKITVAEDGMYKVTRGDLVVNGFTNAQLKGSDLQLYSMGVQVPIYVSNDGQWVSGDYFIFQGSKQRGELDAHLFEDASKEQLNPQQSMFSDERAYYLRIKPGATNSERFQDKTSDLSGNLPLPEKYFMEKEMVVFNNFEWNPGTPTTADVHYSHFISNEGFASTLQRETDVEFKTVGYYDGPNPPNSNLTVRTGSNNVNHLMELSFNNSLILTDDYSGPLINEYDTEIAVNFVKKDGPNRIKVKGFSSSDNLNVAFAEFTYPRTYDAINENLVRFYTGNGNFDQYIEYQNFSGNKPLVFDVENKCYVEAKKEGSTAKFLLPNAAIKSAMCYIVDDSALKSATSFKKVDLVDLDGINPEYLILTSEKLNVNVGGVNPITEYEQFRASSAGGGYKTAVINVEQIYDQFGYGVHDHCLSVRNFAQYIKNKWPDFEMVFILGKALNFSNKYQNTTIENLVPTYGRPGSDNLLFAENGKTFPYVGVGRVAARTPEDVSNYLDKAKANAALSDISNLSIEDRMWLKDVIHLSGGSPDIQVDLFDYLSIMETILEENMFGADVTTFRKFSSDAVTTTLTQKILGKIKNGISMLTFFGHSSAGTFDFSVEDPAAWDNEGKLPVVFSMGCHSGDIHENSFSMSENFIMTKDLGAIAFLASSGNAFADALALTGNGYYEKIGTNFYGKPIGLAIRQVMEDEFNRILALYNQGPMTIPFFDNYVHLITLIEQNTLHGDPAIVYFSAEGADYVIDFATVETSSVVGVTDEFVELNFDILNLGKNPGDITLNNYVTHQYGDNQVDTTFFTSPPTRNRESITVKIPNPGNLALGKNSINIVLDYDNQVDERPLPSAEDNNDMMWAWNIADGFCYYVFDNKVKPIYPDEYGIINSQNIDLIASSSNALGDKAFYLLEMDTTEQFDSPFLQQAEVFSSPAAIRWSPNVTYEHETVYYWRVKARDEQLSIWNSSSFVYLNNGAPGWNQSHYFQLADDSYTDSYRDSTTRDWVYVNDINDIRIKNGLAARGGFLPNISHVSNLNNYIPYSNEITSGVYLASFDGVTGVPLFNSYVNDGEHGSVLHAEWASDHYIYPYWTRTKAERASVINYIENVVDDGDYVAFFTIQRSDSWVTADYKPELWAADGANGDDDIFSVLEKYGATTVRQLESGAVPYIFVFKKGDTSFDVIEVKGDNFNSRIEADFEIIAKWHEGEVSSTVIGPATSWDKLLWNIDEIDLQEDTYTFDIYGIGPDGTETLLFENVDEFSFDLSSVDATLYPFLRLKLFSSDETSRTAPQLEYWRVLFDELPEAVLDIEAKLVYEADSLLSGTQFKFETLATNVSSADMDSLLVEFSVTDQSNNVQKFNKRLAPLKANESIPVDFNIGSDGLLGLNEFKVEINPGPEQMEKHYFNNLGLRSFFVLGDNINPLLDVTFDGIRIMDGDIVSPSPLITVILKDENTFLPVTDVSNFTLSLQAHPDNQAYPIDLTGDNVNFYPADSTNGYCARLEFTPEPELESGEYTLTVQATDASGNLSGDRAIVIDFEVIREAMVSSMLNYPNPFSTSTQFIFTLTGASVPDVFTIQIYTLSGKVVKEITRDELGPLRIGQNRTDYKWNGTDDFGNKLANGVYLYRLVTSQVENKDLLHFDNVEVDGFFNKGFGKLVIMR